MRGYEGYEEHEEHDEYEEYEGRAADAEFSVRIGISGMTTDNASGRPGPGSGHGEYVEYGGHYGYGG